jgi:hypothetical protein
MKMNERGRRHRRGEEAGEVCRARMQPAQRHSALPPPSRCSSRLASRLSFVDRLVFRGAIALAPFNSKVNTRRTIFVRICK